MNLDNYILERLNSIYENERRNVFINMITKHSLNLCRCAKTNKICKNHGNIDLIKLDDKDYIIGLYDSGIIQTLYNMCQSVTQSLRCRAGKHFERVIEEVFKMEKISYSSQVKIDGKHVVDFVLPNRHIPKIIISCKTTLRERYLQDLYLDNVVIITLDKKQNNAVRIDFENQIFTKWIKDIKEQYKMKVLDLFCGCGGFTEGFSKANFEIVAGIDINPVAIQTYKKNHDHLALCKDLTVYPPEILQSEHSISDVDIIVGGPPCQGFSNAGKRDIKDPRNSLFMEFYKYVEFFKPKVFVMENVIGILSMKNSRKKKYIDIISEILEVEYNIKICKLYASDFQVPQNRRRVIIFGIRKDLGLLPTEPKSLYEKHDRPIVGDILEQDVDEKYYLSVRALKGIKLKKERMKLEGKGFGAQFLKLDKPSYTIPARYWKDGYDALVKYSDERVRRLTLLELARIQTFPDSYIFCGTRKEIIIQIGNAVACNFGYNIAKHVKHMLS